MTTFVQNVQQPRVQPGLPILTLNTLTRNRRMGSTRGARYAYRDTEKGVMSASGPDDFADADESTPKRGGGADALKLLPQRTAEEIARDKENLMGRSRPVGAFGGDRVEAGGEWEEEGGSSGIDRSQGDGGGDEVRSGFAPALSVQQWDSLMRSRVLQRRQGRSNGLVSTASR